MKLLGKLFLITLACVGIALMVLGTLLPLKMTLDYIQAPEEYWEYPLAFEYAGVAFGLGFMLGSVGISLALIGGLAARPRYMWIVLLLVGLFYCVTVIVGINYPTYKHLAHPDRYPDASYRDNIGGLLLLLIPGIAAIIGAIIIRKPERHDQQHSATR